jgi:hypothetical protein
MQICVRPSLPCPPSSDSYEDREIDFDDHLDYMDQDIPAGQFPPADQYINS